MFPSERVEAEEENLLSNNQPLDHSDSDNDEPENRADTITIEEINDEDIQPIHIGRHTASVEVRSCSLLCTVTLSHTYKYGMM